MNRQRIIMNFSTAPTLEDVEAMAALNLESLPPELARHCAELKIAVEEFPDSTVEADLNIESPYDLIAFFRSGSHVAAGVKRKVANDDDVLFIYRRPLLDMWCETGEDLHVLVRQVIIEEIGQTYEFSANDIAEMVAC